MQTSHLTSNSSDAHTDHQVSTDNATCKVAATSDPSSSKPSSGRSDSSTSNSSKSACYTHTVTPTVHTHMPMFTPYQQLLPVHTHMPVLTPYQRLLPAQPIHTSQGTNSFMPNVVHSNVSSSILTTGSTSPPITAPAAQTHACTMLTVSAHGHAHHPTPMTYQPTTAQPMQAHASLSLKQSNPKEATERPS